MICALSVAVALTLALVPSFLPRTVSSPSATQTIPITVYDGGAVVVSVSIAGAGRYRFLLDTGSTRSAITTRLARQLKSQVVAQTAMVTPAGVRMRHTALVQSLKVGRAERAAVEAMVIPDDALPRAARVDGLLGQDVLANHTYTIDYQRRVLVWHDGGTDHISGHRVALTTVHGLHFVSIANLPGASGPARLLADSGADSIVLFAAAGKSVRSAAPMEAGLLRTSAGLQLGRRVWLDELDLNGITLRNQSALLLPDRESGLLGDGLLPLHLFKRVTFDAAARALIVATR